MCLPSGIRCSSASPDSVSSDDQLALATNGSSEGTLSVDLGDLAGVLRTTGFEKLGNPRKTTGNITGLGTLRGVFASWSPPWTFAPSFTER
jgi:hypothetical protein